jgi:transposase
MTRKTFKFRLYSNRQQRDRLTATLEVCRELYHAALQERIGAWKSGTPVLAGIESDAGQKTSCHANCSETYVPAYPLSSAQVLSAQVLS